MVVKYSLCMENFSSKCFNMFQDLKYKNHKELSLGPSLSGHIPLMAFRYVNLDKLIVCNGFE